MPIHSHTFPFRWLFLSKPLCLQSIDEHQSHKTYLTGSPSIFVVMHVVKNCTLQKKNHFHCNPEALPPLKGAAQETSLAKISFGAFHQVRVYLRSVLRINKTCIEFRPYVSVPVDFIGLDFCGPCCKENSSLKPGT